ncbi:hypothetical protein CGRA01v4_07054 [Colletotrichum graminicola]|nr:hypothetical protein CGRA01v4_07054 [Colletotrichum graminicola]
MTELFLSRLRDYGVTVDYIPH